MSSTKFLFLIALFMPIFSFAQNAAVNTALQKGSAPDITPYLAKNVDLILLKDESTVTPQQATTILADFFTKSTVKGYKENHFSAAQNGKSTYSIGELTTADSHYRVTIFYNGDKKISEIRIEK
jgi:hypothetical protein